MKKSLRHRSLAICCAAIAFPAAMAVGTLSGSLFKLANPNNIDVWQPLAYLSHAVIPGVVVFLALLGIAVMSIAQLYRQERTLQLSARLPVAIVLVNLILAAVLFGGQAITRIAEDNWARANGQMTHEQRDRQLEHFFQNTDAQRH